MNIKEILLEIQQRLATVSDLKYIDRNWSQLNYEQPPVKWPCALIDVKKADYTQCGHLAQIAEAEVEVMLAVLRLTPTSIGNPNRESTFDLCELYDEVNGVLHGWHGADFTALIRTQMEEVENSKSLHVYKVRYKTTWKVPPVLPTETVTKSGLPIKLEVKLKP